MNLNQIALDLARERHERLIAKLARERLLNDGRPSIRQSIGRRVIAVGERIAAESRPELARSPCWWPVSTTTSTCGASSATSRSPGRAP
jgi:hypothetical protein